MPYHYGMDGTGGTLLVPRLFAHALTTECSISRPASASAIGLQGHLSNAGTLVVQA